MAYVVPTFNLAFAIWRGPWAVPPVGPPALVGMCNLTPGRRGNFTPVVPGVYAPGVALMFVLFPALTDVRDKLSATGADLVECPAGSGRYYGVIGVDDVAKGFANEYRWAAVHSVGKPTPIP